MVLSVAAFVIHSCSPLLFTPIPTDVSTSLCNEGNPDFQTWFDPHPTTVPVPLNAVANPANSVTFSNAPNCDFYKWSEHMFLWLTSPTPATYGGGNGRIFFSPAFYDVSPLDANMDRTLIPHLVNTIPILTLRAAQRGFNNLPVIVDTKGTMFEIAPSRKGPTGRQLVLNQSGDSVELDHIVIDPNKHATFFDQNNKIIPEARPMISSVLKGQLIAQKFIIENRPVFLDAASNVIDVEAGQSDGGSVLMAVNGSLVYYSIMVNDVYAYFLTGTKDGGITPTPTKFPTTQSDLNKITTFASAHGKTFPDPEALAVEVKTSWIEASKLSSSELPSYITMTATIPDYDGPPGSANPNTTTWTPIGQKTVLLAMVGMHVVGSAAGHPEMIWATFEHRSNAPSGHYTYTTSSGTNFKDPDVTSGHWMFCKQGADLTQMNKVHMTEDASGNIVAFTSFDPLMTISPSNTIRPDAWGAVDGVSPNPIDPTSTSSNSELISINNTVQHDLDGNDVRKNYIMTGCTWTINGLGFTTNFGNPGNTGTTSGKAVGTNQMANTTMETYQQAFPNTFNSFGNNCFSCHQTNNTDVSHIFFTPGSNEMHGLKPLF